MLSKTLSPTFKRFLASIGPYVIASMWTIIIWLGAMDILEMALTEWKYLYNSLLGNWRLISFFAALVVSASVLTLWQKRQKKISLSFLYLSGVFFLLTLVAHHQYAQYYDWLQTLPKLKSISTLETIQAERVVIIGRNFGHPDQRGEVRVGNLEFIIISWNDEEVVAEQPVPSRYFVDDLVLKNNNGNELFIQNFSIKNPLDNWQ